MTDYALAMTALHADYAAKIIELAENSVASGEPINRPIWWLDPTDQEALAIDSGKKDTVVCLEESNCLSYWTLLEVPQKMYFEFYNQVSL